MLQSIDLVGLAVLILGVTMLMDADLITLPVPVLMGAGLVAGALLLWVVVRFMRQRRIPVRGGQEQLQGARATALYAFDGRGHVRLHGERWEARSAVPVACGEPLRVTRVEGLTLYVTPTAPPSKEGVEP